MKATFEADFSTFRSEVDKSLVQLRGFEAESTNVTTALSKMVDQFTGRKLITEATLMAEAVERIGGAAMLTDAELVRVARTAIDAADKFAAMGQEIPKEIQGLIDYADAAVKAAAKTKELHDTMDEFGPQTIKTAGSVGSLHRSLNEFNNLLAAGGVHLSAELGALGDLGNFAGKTAAQLGTLAVAGGVVGSAMAGLNIGRKIAEFAGTDKIIGDATAALLGWGSVAKEVAAANADVLAEASKHAGVQIRDLTEAMQINATFAKDLATHWEKVATERQKAVDQEIKSAQDTIRIEHEMMAAGDKLVAQEHEIEAIHKREAEQLMDNLHAIERAGTAGGTTAGILGLNAEEQRRTQARFGLAKGITGGGAAAAVDTSNPFAVYADDLKKADDELRRNIALGEERYHAEIYQKTQIEAANQKFLESMLKAADANDAWIKSLSPKGADTILPWSTLGVKPITVKPIAGSFMNTEGAAVTVNVSGVMDPRTIRELTDAVAGELMRRSGRQLPSA